MTRIAVGGISFHVLLGIVLIVIPWYRGHSRAEQAHHDFARYAACLFDGTAADKPGLGLPDGDRARFASQFVLGKEEWPARCRPLVRQVSPADAWFVWPPMRDAEGEVRRAVALVDEELGRISRGHRSEAIAERPLQANGRLLAALSEWSRAAGIDIDPSAHAIQFEGAADIVEPARVPLGLSREARVRFRPFADGIDISGVDHRRIAWLRAAGGRTTLERLRRRGPARGTLFGADRAIAVFATEESRCGLDRCVGRALGLRPLGDGSTWHEGVEPRWLRGHPAGAVEASVRLHGDHALAVIISETPALTLARFELGAGDGRSVPATWRVPLELSDRTSRALLQAREVLWSVGGESPVLYRAPISTSDAPEAPRVEPEKIVLGAGVQSLDPCGAGVLVDTGDALGLLTEEWTVQADAPPGERMAVACTEDRIHAIYRDGVRAMHVACGDRCEANPIPGDFQSETRVALGCTQDECLIARSDGGAIQLAAVRSGAEGPLEFRVVAACWDSAEGFCGAPQIAARAGRFLVAAFERGDYRVIESVDGGRTFQSMRGIR
ncbi:MAG: hypothetical protein AAGF12_10920 [Myxococcota bacterium]